MMPKRKGRKMPEKLTPRQRIATWADYFGETFLESYFYLIEMGKVRESDSLRNWAEKQDEKSKREIARLSR